MIDTPEEWLEIIQSILKAHLSNLEVRAFGSRVNGIPKPHSDLDIVLMTKEMLPPGKMAVLKEAFEESDLPIKIDVVDWAAISDEFQKIIEQNSEVLQKGMMI